MEYYQERTWLLGQPPHKLEPGIDETGGPQRFVMVDPRGERSLPLCTTVGISGALAWLHVPPVR